MKKYTSPNMKITAFDIDDIITVSAANGVIVHSSELTGNNATLYEAYKQGSGVDNTSVSIFTW